MPGGGGRSPPFPLFHPSIPTTKLTRLPPDSSPHFVLAALIFKSQAIVCSHSLSGFGSLENQFNEKGSEAELEKN